MPIGSLASLILGLAVLSIGFYHVAFVGPRLRSISRTLSGEDIGADVDSLARLRSSASSFAKRTEERLAELETIAKRDVHRVGFVRYNSFSDVGSDQSFSLALLNSEGDGVVVTSIYSREETRTYGKAVKKFVPQQGASKEEQAAILMARDGAQPSR
ncbi:MAG: DUF4446 family protein [Candidatus Baltobacteraceae bacterium]|jgi:hypothetical protein